MVRRIKGMAVVVVVVVLLVPSVVLGQSRWTGRLEAGYATSTHNSSSGLGGGSFGGSVFLGRELNGWLALGAEVGFYRVRDETTLTAVGCTSPSTPGALECTSVRDDQNRWIQAGVTLLMSPTRGSWRPYASVGLGAWFAKGTNTIDIIVDATGQSEPGFPTSSSSDAFALGASLGAGVDWSPGDGPWSVGAGARIHLLEGGNSFGDYGGDRVVTAMLGVRYHW